MESRDASSTRSEFLQGRTDGFQSIRFQRDIVLNVNDADKPSENKRIGRPGDYVEVQVQERDGRIVGLPKRIVRLTDFNETRSGES